MSSPAAGARRDLEPTTTRDAKRASLPGRVFAALRPGTRGERVAVLGLVAVLAAGAVMRLLFLLAWRPAFFGFPDAVTYVGLALEKLWVDPTREVGYPLFLRELHAIFPTHLTWVMALQHLFGLASALLVFLAVRRANGPPWLGLLPAALIALNGAEMFLEHTTLTESLFIFLLALALYFAARAAGASMPAGPLRDRPARAHGLLGGSDACGRVEPVLARGAVCGLPQVHSTTGHERAV